MSKIAYEFAKNIPWLDEVSTINTVFFFIMLIVIIIGVLRMKKKDVDEYKNMPLDDGNEKNTVNNLKNTLL
jgi:cbb3-type cytochrome oxidase subunit 3